MYVARDENGQIFLFNEKPIKQKYTNDNGVWVAGGGCMYVGTLPLSKSIDPSWEDSKPIKVKLVRDNTHG